ncbi:MAG: histidine kinase [Bacteroidota bacterium]|nr:histidine kinase [Bacteroidota bacterium]
MRLLRHAGFWLSFVLLFLVIYGPVFNNFPWLFLSSMVMLPFTMVVVYTINYLLLPKFLKQKRYISLGMIVLLILILEPPLPRILVMILKEEAFNFKNFMDYNMLPFYFETGLIIFIALSIKLFKERNREQEEKNQLETQKLQAELTALKSQLNSHFLFNTLNNLYGLAKKKSDLAPAGILMLSDMLHFVLYECADESYPLQKELDFINNYIELEKLRYGERLRIEMEEELHHSEAKIAPLLLFPFVENSFKHGASKKINEVWIKIRIASNQHQLTFEVENNRQVDQSVKPNTAGGVGLENVQKRLHILYPEQHTLTIRSDDSTFSVHLIINQESES